MGKSLVKNIYFPLLMTVLKNIENFQKGKSTKEGLSTLNSYSIHPLIQTCKGPDNLLELAYVRKNREF